MEHGLRSAGLLFAGLLFSGLLLLVSGSHLMFLPLVVVLTLDGLFGHHRWHGRSGIERTGDTDDAHARASLRVARHHWRDGVRDDLATQ
jgi:hypothetical protein